MGELRVVLEKDDTLGEEAPNREVLATDVEVADSLLSTGRGLMFRPEIPEGFALVMEVGGGSLLPIPRGPSRQVVHMLFVRFPLDVVWIADDEVRKVKRLRPWRGVGVGKADRIVELPAGAAADVDIGDTVVVDGLNGE